jgi:hypothetical protein
MAGDDPDGKANYRTAVGIVSIRGRDVTTLDEFS